LPRRCLGTIDRDDDLEPRRMSRRDSIGSSVVLDD
jgi:hypothetical protein